MYDIILEAADKHCPMRDINLRSVRPGWMTIDTVEALNDKHRLYRLAKASGTDNDWKAYQKVRQHARKLMKSTKEQFIIQELENCTNDPKKLWKKLHKNLGTEKQNSKSLETIKDENGNILVGKTVGRYCLLIYAHKANQCHNAGSTWKNGFSMPKNCMMRNL